LKIKIQPDKKFLLENKNPTWEKIPDLKFFHQLKSIKKKK